MSFRKLITFLLPLALLITLIMTVLSLKEVHGIPIIGAAFGVLGTIFYFLMTKILSRIIQREGLDD